ncbi:hypothetical protein KIL84_002630 [Mauremys mutica]|uniref:Uncharacterized protein n=1 Tax=Mauremys mutica TaxID=74926 RepID=A0A9D3WLM6_9SAUR|nr:hypothetical protein KIL84_002630 [Mauremys mutica]
MSHPGCAGTQGRPQPRPPQCPAAVGWEEEEEWVEEEEEEEEETEEEDVSPEQETIRVIQQHLQGRAELVEDRAQQLGFLHVVPCLCFLAQQQGLDSLEPQVSKAALVESIAVVLTWI